jgi:hypothetical protein
MADRIPPHLLPMMMRPLGNPAVPLRSAPMVQTSLPNNDDVDRGYWRGWGPDPTRRVMTVPNDRPIYALPTEQQVPPSDDPQMAMWFNTNCPPWVCPPYWSKPLELAVNACVPWYEVDTLLGNLVVPKDWFYVVTDVSYEALNAVQDDVFEFSVLVSNNLVGRWEDSIADAAQPNPAEQDALSGHYRTLPLWFIADRRSNITIRGRLRGQINLAGVSPNWAGEPILSTNCQMKVILHGWMANLREDVDGGPRPTDLGDFGFIYLHDDQGGGQA